jgi:hypothetical protein
MSTTLSTLTMITGSTTSVGLQTRFPMGIGTNQWMGYLNEAFRKINQMQKGGFIWQLKLASINIPAGAQVANPLPADFDPGKSAFLYSTALAVTPTTTMIPFMPVEEFVKQQQFQVTGPGILAAWTFFPNTALGPPTSYAWTMKLAPDTAFPIPPPGFTMGFYYHAVNFPQFTAAANVFFPTPDQFDSMILDMAEAEARRQYGAAGWDKLAAQATQSVQELVDTYRTDRYDLAGVGDVTMQAQEKAAERDR